MTVWVNRPHRPIPDFVRTIITGQANVTLIVTLPVQGPELDPHAAAVPKSAGGTQCHRSSASVTLLCPESQRRLVAAERVFEIQ
jgi:hypothetical protein